LLESIRAQTYPRDRLETIVTADGSGDASAAIARSFLVRHAMQGTVLVGARGMRRRGDEFGMASRGRRMDSVRQRPRRSGAQ
jgi:hypothetical protein